MTYNGRTIITFPSAPAAASVEPTYNALSSVSTSPFTGQQQVQQWAAGWLEFDLTFPPMSAAQTAAFTAFYVAAQGQACVFQLPSWLQAYVPTGLAPSGYWSLKTNESKWSINIGQIGGFHMIIREVVA